jgi:hypothetical protein
MKANATRPRLVPSNAADRFRVLVKEAGSSPLTSGGSEAYDQTVVIAQMRGESPLNFTERVLERVASLARSGRRLCAATLQAGDRHDAATIVARRTMLLALLEQAARVGGISEVLLEAHGAAAGPGSAELLTLVDELLQRPECDALPVRLRFQGAGPAAPEADSGVFWVVPTSS